MNTVLFGVCWEVEGGGDNDTLSEVPSVEICCVVGVCGCVMLKVFTVDELTLFGTAKLVRCAVLVGNFVTCVVAEEVVVSAKEQKA